MELRELSPPEFDVLFPGIYVIDASDPAIFAGPFETTTGALDWIEQWAPGRSQSVNPKCGAISTTAQPEVISRTEDHMT